MKVEEIGTYAGIVWQALSVSEAVGTKQLKKMTKLKDKELYAALGWLGREGKIDIQPNPDDAKELLVVLTQEQ